MHGPLDLLAPAVGTSQIPDQPSCVRRGDATGAGGFGGLGGGGGRFNRGGSFGFASSMDATS